MPSCLVPMQRLPQTLNGLPWPWLWAKLICFGQQDVSRREGEGYNLFAWMNLPSRSLSWLREECAPGAPCSREDKETWSPESRVYLGSQPPSPRARAWALPLQWHTPLLAQAQPRSALPQIHGWWVWGCSVTRHYYGNSWQTEWKL